MGFRGGGVKLTPPQRILVFKYPSRDRVNKIQQGGLGMIEIVSYINEIKVGFYRKLISGFLAREYKLHFARLSFSPEKLKN